MHMPLNTSIAKRCKVLVAAVACAFALAIPATVAAAPLKWEQTKTERTDIRTEAKDAEVEIRASRGLVQVSASKPVHIKVYTILGTLVSSENLPAGISQLPIQAHGIYIIKTASLTCKVAL